MKGICRGTILHRMFETTTPPKPKFFVIIGESETHVIGYFFINSNINNYVQRRKFYDMQMPIKRNEYPFLKYDSFIGAHELNMIDKSLLAEELASGETSIKGCLNIEDMDRLLEAAKASDLFSPYEKDTYFR